jgi:propanol-preferring alcohol dehydrogenase
MQAMQLQQPGPISDEPLISADVPAAEPGSGFLRLRVRTCGVCHTDLHTVEGDLALPKLPIIPGHQIVGIVEERGPDSTRFRIGDRVGVAWLYSTCGECAFCAQGLENLCPDAQFTGLDRDGGYAEYVTVDERFVYPLPDQFSDVEAAPLLCAGIIGYRALLLSGIRPEGRLGLYGFGASAHLAIQVARHWECDVYVFTRSDEHRRHALELGAVWTGEAQHQPPVKLDASVTFAPAGWIVPLAMAHLRPGGTLAINAIHMSQIPAMDYNLIYGERVIRTVANFTRQDAAEFLRVAAEIPVNITAESHPLAEANRVLARLKASRIRGAAVLEVGSLEQS